MALPNAKHGTRSNLADWTAYWHQVVAGRRGMGPAILRAALRLGEWGYRAAVAWRNRRYDRRPELVHRVEVPVVSVGNLTVGGTGKTPLVVYLARQLRRRGLRVAVISRGYKSPEGSVNDEALELERLLPDVPHLQNPDRVQAARVAIRELESQVLLLDDGFQHRRLGRDLDIVLLDALCPWGHGHLLPRGLLREPIHALRRAQAVVLSRCDLVDRETTEAIRRQVDQVAPGMLWCQARHRPRGLLAASGRRRDLDHLAGLSVAAFCGIGNPQGFRRTLEQLGCRLRGFRSFPDHHLYQRSDVEELQHWAARLGAEAVLCTGKDLVKLGVDRLDDLPLWALEIELELVQGEAELLELLEKTVQARPELPT